MGYLRIPLVTNVDQLKQDVYNYIRARIPLWQPNDGALDTWIIAALSLEAAQNRDLAADVPDTIFRTLGASLFGIPPGDAVSATAQTTWTMINNAGYTIPAGTTVSVVNTSGIVVPFQTVADVVVPAGTVATPAGTVVIAALVPGAAGSGLGTGGATIELVDVLDFVSGIVQTGPTTGGVDAESDDAYLARLVRRFRRLSERPILPQDFAEMAKDADAGVFRAVAIDLYDPVLATYAHPRTITIAAVDVNGNAATAPMKANIDALLQANREVNFVVFEMDPNYNDIKVQADVVALVGFDHPTVQTSVTALINDYLSKAKWGRDPRLTGTDADQSWVDKTTLYYNDLLAAIDTVQGVDRVADLQISKNPAALARVNVALTGPASLTNPFSVVVNVT